MLYVWPYAVFFSLPLVSPFLLNAAIPRDSLPLLLRTSNTKPRRPQMISAVLIIALMLAVVHYSTIVHPFTLADNRHYMFYVFRILLRHPSIRYLAVPVYFVCAWGSLITVGSTIQPEIKVNGQVASGISEKLKPSASDKVNEGERVSWLLIWLATTTLSLSTAPLVEPRYCILPWLIWRMHLPTPVAGTSLRLWLETAWFLLINAVTGYIFLYWGFGWMQEPDRVQRFMW